MEYFQSGDWKEARACFRRVIGLAPDNFDALHLCGVMEHRLNNLTEAENLIRRAIAIDGSVAEAHYNLGRVLQDADRREDMVAAYRSAIAIDPGLEFAHFNLGLALLAGDDAEAAAESFRKARALNPRDPDYALNLGLALQRLGDSRGALSAYEQAIRLNPNFAPAHNCLGILLKDTGRHDEAIAAYGRAIQSAPGFADADFNLGNALEEAGRLEEALSSYQSAIAKRPDFAKAYNNLGNVYYATGDREQALAAYRQAAALDSGLETAHHMVNCLSGGTSDAAPTGYVKSLFDKAAGEFEKRLVGDLEYRSPSELSALLTRCIEPGHRFQNALDLGCGTGLAAEAFHPLATRLTGVDISPRMVERARAKNFYNALAVGDLMQYLSDNTETFDLVLATDVLVYFGNLRPLFQAVHGNTAIGAYFLFSLEAGETEDFVLRTTGRYAHARDYIHRLAGEAGFRVACDEDTVIRMENGQPIPGINFILQKSPPSPHRD
jgi:predicted TPR repeat methyltransferase